MKKTAEHTLFDIPSEPTQPPMRRDKIIWTAAAIGHCVGTSPDFVRHTLTKLPGSPVKQIGGRYCAIEKDLINFFRSYRN